MRNKLFNLHGLIKTRLLCVCVCVCVFVRFVYNNRGLENLLINVVVYLYTCGYQESKQFPKT